MVRHEQLPKFKSSAAIIHRQLINCTGTWLSSSDVLPKAVAYAIKEAGYRHIDCAWGYFNEAAVGEGIRQSGIAREELFVRVVSLIESD